MVLNGDNETIIFIPTWFSRDSIHLSNANAMQQNEYSVSQELLLRFVPPPKTTRGPVHVLLNQLPVPSQLFQCQECC